MFKRIVVGSEIKKIISKKSLKEFAKDALQAAGVILAAFLIYSSAGRTELFGGKENKVDAYEIRVNERFLQSDGKWQKKQTYYWASTDGKYLVRSKLDGGKVEKWVFDGEILWINSNGKIRILEYGLIPSSYEFNEMFGKFIVENIQDIPHVEAFPEKMIKGKRCLCYIIWDPLNEKVSYETWIDTDTHFPIRLKKKFDEQEFYTMEVMSVDKSKNIPIELEKKKPNFDGEGIERPYEKYKVTASGIGTSLNLKVVPPGYMPPDIDKFSYFILPKSEFLKRWIGEPKREVALMSYNGPKRYVQIFQYEGTPREINIDYARQEEIEGEIVEFLAGPGYWWTQVIKNGLIINVKGNVSFDEMRDILASMLKDEV